MASYGTEGYLTLNVGDNVIDFATEGISVDTVKNKNNSPRLKGDLVFDLYYTTGNVKIPTYSPGDSPGPKNNFNVSVVEASGYKPTKVKITVPSDFDPALWTANLYVTCYVVYDKFTIRVLGGPPRKMESYYTFKIFFNAFNGGVTSGPPVAPAVFNITGNSAQFSCPDPLLSDYVAYRPELYDPTIDLWVLTGPDCYGGEVLTASPLIPETSGYKVRFVGIPDPTLSDITVNGSESTAFTTGVDTGPVVCPPYQTGKKTSPEYKSMLNQSPTTRALIIKVTRTDGKIFGYTTVPGNINGDDILENGNPIPELAGVTFYSKGGISPTGVSNSNDLGKVDNLDVELLISDDAMSEDDIRAGLFDGASVLIGEVNYEDLSMGIMRHKKGYIGELSYDESKFRGEVVSVAQKLQNPIIDETSVLCRVKKFGNVRCGVNLSGKTTDGYDITSTGTVSAVDTVEPARILSIPEASSIPDGYYNYGRVTMTKATSKNHNVERKIRKHQGSTIELAEKLPFPAEVGDTVELIIGCDRRMETCAQRFANGARFDGEPHTPGVDIYTVVSS